MLVDMLLPPLCVDADHHKGKKYVHFVVLKVRFSRMNHILTSTIVYQSNIVTLTTVYKSVPISQSKYISLRINHQHITISPVNVSHEIHYQLCNYLDGQFFVTVHREG